MSKTIDSGDVTRLTDVADGVLAYLQLDGSWGLSNCGLIIDNGETVVIDTCFTEKRTRDLIERMGMRGSRSVKAVANTHHHRDHTNGNGLLRPAAIIGHERCREALLSTHRPTTNWFPDVDFGNVEASPPWITFDSTMTFFAGEIEVQAISVSPAHTTNDAVYWLPQQKVLFAGDLLFNKGTPFFAAGSLSGSLAALDVLEDLQPSVIVPGHGEICGPEVIAETRGYLEWILQHAKDAFSVGTSPLDAAHGIDLGEFSEWLDKERIVANLHRAFSELAGEPSGMPLDMDVLFGDMVAFNGGEPLHCRA